MKLLVGRGAKVGLRDSSGDSPYDLAIQCDFYVCAELLDDLASKYTTQNLVFIQFYK